MYQATACVWKVPVYTVPQRLQLRLAAALPRSPRARIRRGRPRRRSDCMSRSSSWMSLRDERRGEGQPRHGQRGRGAVPKRRAVARDQRRPSRRRPARRRARRGARRSAGCRGSRAAPSRPRAIISTVASAASASCGPVARVRAATRPRSPRRRRPAPTARERRAAEHLQERVLGERRRVRVGLAARARRRAGSRRSRGTRARTTGRAGRSPPPSTSATVLRPPVGGDQLERRRAR